MGKRAVVLARRSLASRSVSRRMKLATVVDKGCIVDKIVLKATVAVAIGAKRAPKALERLFLAAG